MATADTFTFSEATADEFLFEEAPRMQPRELYRAQGFPDSYIIGDDPSQGLSLTKTQQVHLCGNSVPPDVEAAIVADNYTEDFVTQREARMPLLEVL